MVGWEPDGRVSSWSIEESSTWPPLVTMCTLVMKHLQIIALIALATVLTRLLVPMLIVSIEYGELIKISSIFLDYNSRIERSALEIGIKIFLSMIFAPVFETIILIFICRFFQNYFGKYYIVYSVLSVSILAFLTHGFSIYAAPATLFFASFALIIFYIRMVLNYRWAFFYGWAAHLAANLFAFMFWL